jgi:hypothetical protein
MIDIGISFGFGEENKHNLESIPKSIQLVTYRYDVFKNVMDDAITQLKDSETEILSFHFPLDALNQDYNEILMMMTIFYREFNCKKFIIHPNKGIHTFIRKFLWYMSISHRDINLCIETFGWRSRKELRSPLEIIEACIPHPELSMCLDTSHIEPLWFEPKLMRYLLKHTDVIHLSNRAKGHGQHMPFNSPHGNLNLVAFVKDLKKMYNWDGKLILEYMPQYRDKLYKNCAYIKRLLK